MTTPADYNIAFVAAAANEAAATSITAGKPTGTEAGDLLVALVCRNNNADPSAVPSGWSLVAAHKPSASYGYRLYVKVAGASEPSDYTWTWSSGSYYARALVLAYRGGFDAADVVDVYSNTAYTTNNTTLRAAAVTAAADHTAVIALGAVYNNPAVAVTFTPADGWTEDYDGGDRWRMSVSHVTVDDGSTGDIDVTMSGSYTDKHAFLLALNPRPYSPASVDDWTEVRSLHALKRLRLLAGSTVELSIVGAANKVYVRVKDSGIVEEATYNEPEDPLAYDASPREVWMTLSSGDATAAAQVAALTLERRRGGQLSLSGLQCTLAEGLELHRGELVGVQIDRWGLAGVYPIRELVYDVSRATCQVTVGDGVAERTDTDTLVTLARRLDRLEREA